VDSETADAIESSVTSHFKKQFCSTTVQQTTSPPWHSVESATKTSDFEQKPVGRLWVLFMSRSRSCYRVGRGFFEHLSPEVIIHDMTKYVLTPPTTATETTKYQTVQPRYLLASQENSCEVNQDRPLPIRQCLSKPPEHCCSGPSLIPIRNYRPNRFTIFCDGCLKFAGSGDVRLGHYHYLSFQTAAQKQASTAV
jgi:hypothetical protein